MKSLQVNFTSSLILFLLIQLPLFAQQKTELETCYYHLSWYDWAADTIARDSLQFSVKERADRYILVDKVVNRRGKLRRKDFGGFALQVDGKYYVQHMDYSGYLNDMRLLVRYHVFGLQSANFIAIDDPKIDLDQHNYTGFGIIGDAIAESVKNRKDRSNKVWVSEEGTTYSIIHFGSILNEDGQMELINNQPVLLSEKGLNYLASHFKPGSTYVDKTDWTAEEIGAFLTEINEAEGKSIVKFESLDFSSTGE